MTNGHVEGVNGSTGATVLAPKSTSDRGDMENTMEHMLMRAFVQQRQLRRTTEAPAEPSPAANGPAQAPESKGATKEPNRKEKNKKRKGWRRLPLIGKCISPKTKEPEPEPEPEAAHEPEPKVLLRGFIPERTAENEFEKVAKRLTGLADEIQFIPPEFETDSDNDLEKLIGLLLRENGDRFNQRMKEEKINPTVLFSYNFFEVLLTTFLETIGYRNARSDDLQPQACTETQVAVACEITSRLSAVDTLPSNRMLNFGAAYLQQHYSHWVQQQSQTEAEIHSDEEVE